MDPMQRLLLETAYRALENCKFTPITVMRQVVTLHSWHADTVGLGHRHECLYRLLHE